MTDKDWFSKWFSSPWYSVLYEHRDDLEAEHFVDGLAEYLQPPPGSRMLDIACGEGRYAVQLAEKGFQVTGIDLSVPSINKALEQAVGAAGDFLEFYVHDMRLPFRINYYDYAFNFFTSFGYFATRRDNEKAAAAFASALKKGGILVVDYLNRDYSVQRLIAEETIERDNASFHIKRRLEGDHFIKEINILTSTGEALQFTERVAAFSMQDFSQLFSAAGLDLIGTFGDYTLQEFSPLTSPRLITVYKK